MRSSFGNNAQVPRYPAGSTNPARWDNPDQREGFPAHRNLNDPSDNQVGEPQPGGDGGGGG